MIRDLDLLQLTRELEHVAAQWFASEGVDVDPLEGDVVGVIDDRLLVAMRLPIEGATTRTVAHPPGVAENGSSRGDATGGAGDREASGGSEVGGQAPAFPADAPPVVSPRPITSDDERNPARELARMVLRSRLHALNLVDAAGGAGAVIPSGFVDAVVDLAVEALVPVAIVDSLPVFALDNDEDCTRVVEVIADTFLAVTRPALVPTAPATVAAERVWLLEELLDIAACGHSTSTTRVRSLATGAKRRGTWRDVSVDRLRQLRDDLRRPVP